MPNLDISTAKRDGAYFTPEAIVEALVCWAVRKDTDRLLDPSCGDGRFLEAHPNSVGVEQDPVSARNAIERAPGSLVHEGDFFQWAEATSERFECVAGNPPFIRYQRFSGDTRARALRLCAVHGAKFSGLTSSWAPFVVAAAGVLKRGGRMAFVVPAEIGHAPYAAPLIDYLTQNFKLIQIVAVRKKLFPDLSEDCWLLYAEGYGGSTATIKFTAQDTFEWSATPPKGGLEISVREWRSDWNCRLRPFLLSSNVRDAYLLHAQEQGSFRLGEFAKVGIGYVSGANDFFHLRPSEAKRWDIPKTYLHPAVRNGRSLKGNSITSATVAQWLRDDDEVLLLRLKAGDPISTEVKRYLDSAAGQVARTAYKCRTRAPWYAVPDVQVPDCVLTYMAGRAPTLAANRAGVTCTNTMHGIHFRERAAAAKALQHWGSDFVNLSCEIEGHALGGGMLKLEVREASRILFPKSGLSAISVRELKESIAILRKWRHYDE